MLSHNRMAKNGVTSCVIRIYTLIEQHEEVTNLHQLQSVRCSAYHPYYQNQAYILRRFYRSWLYAPFRQVLLNIFKLLSWTPIQILVLTFTQALI